MFENITFGITASEVVAGAVDLVTMFDSLIILGMALVVAPALVAFIMSIPKMVRG